MILDFVGAQRERSGWPLLLFRVLVFAWLIVFWVGRFRVPKHPDFGFWIAVANGLMP
jgi:hypothetical protein